MKDSNDRILWEQITENDENAFNTIFDKYFITLCKFCYPIVKEIGASEEIVSDVFIKLWLKRHSIQIHGELKPYLCQSVRNTALNYLRNVTPSFNIEEVNEDDMVYAVSADSDILHDEVLNKLEQILKSLSPRQSLILKMYKLEGFNQTEIAEILSLSKKTVQNNIHLALKFLTDQWSIRKYEFSICAIFLLINLYYFSDFFHFFLPFSREDSFLIVSLI